MVNQMFSHTLTKFHILLITMKSPCSQNNYARRQQVLLLHDFDSYKKCTFRKWQKIYLNVETLFWNKMVSEVMSVVLFENNQ